eukprot:149993-Prymnesium_polylepis.1
MPVRATRATPRGRASVRPARCAHCLLHAVRPLQPPRTSQRHATPRGATAAARLLADHGHHHDRVRARRDRVHLGRCNGAARRAALERGLDRSRRLDGHRREAGHRDGLPLHRAHVELGGLLLLAARRRREQVAQVLVVDLEVRDRDLKLPAVGGGRAHRRELTALRDQRKQLLQRARVDADEGLIAAAHALH